MHDRRDGGDDCEGSRHGRGGDDRCGHHGGSRRDCDCERGGHRSAPRGDGPDTRFLQLEMSKVLYGEAESLTKQAFRDLLLEAAKARLRERFGDKITGLAELAVDELMNDVLASLDIEARIQHRTRERSRTEDRLRDIFAAPGSRREGEDGGEGGGGPAGDRGENR